MISVQVLSQRDPRWATQKLGQSDIATIGAYGCTLTCLAMLAKLSDVLKANELLKNNGGFSDALIYWQNVPRGLTNLKFIGRYKYYDNNTVRDYVYNKKIPVVVEVDAAPIGAPRSSHFVLYLGDGKCADPWTGRIRPTNDFPKVKGFALYQYVTPPNTDPVKAILYGSMTDHDKIVELQKLFPQ